ncbi:2022_t:CDS:2 [Acaulospora colombiana]|uniref:2022_t:CDS:1 n=1 Tax=Acaulospora colombiana TaxID=27376 RepID=A0ACA9K5W2_9GLOM|nr:2022_t:CDS:2 [Acaulospora colombiana]
MNNLNLGPNVPKSFGAFPTVGGELAFSELKLAVHVEQSQAYGIKQKRKFGSLFADYDLDWDNNSNKDEPLPKYLPLTLGSGDNDVKLKNHRRTNIAIDSNHVTGRNNVECNEAEVRVLIKSTHSWLTPFTASLLEECRGKTIVFISDLHYLPF